MRISDWSSDVFSSDLVYHDQVTIRVPLKAGAAQPLRLDITSQGCADAGLCYAPMTSSFTLHPAAAGYTVSGQGAVKQLASSPAGSGVGSGNASAGNDTGLGAVLNMGDTGIAAFLATAGWAKIILSCLVLGLLLSFTPCVLPMVPILLAIVAGDAGARPKVSLWPDLALGI